ncbi:MAG: HAD family phosphatase, partial [Candidatus Heimdallarchaeota archaeon]|nr:HAD family phosphatase [Candidatus Heimdallarchaeota archaeon]MCK5049790.1 HAD family phosphatase [Candidatus Heimdallarchaeota archaeon]
MTYQAIFFDVDGTLTFSEPAWLQVHAEMDTLDKEKKYYDAFFRGEFDYFTWAKMDASLWKGQPVTKFEAAFKNIEAGLRPGVKEAFSILKKNNILTYLVSSGIFHFVEQVSTIIDADYAISNIIEKKDGYLTGKVTVNVSDDKSGVLVNYAKEHKLDLQKCAAVGDGFNDRTMFKAVKTSLVIAPKDEKTKNAASVVCQTPDDFRKALMLLFDEETVIYQDLEKSLNKSA